MATFTCLQQILNDLLNKLRIRVDTENAVDYSCHKIISKQELFNCSNNFKGDFERSVLHAKIKIAEQVQQLQEMAGDLRISQSEKYMLCVLETKLAILSSGIDHLLKEGILTLYIDLCEIRSKCSELLIQTFVKKIIKIISSLLKTYFVFQEYLNRKNKNGSSKKNSIFSLKNLNQAKKSQQQKESRELDEHILKEIQQTMQPKSIQSLIDQRLKKEEVDMKQAFQICRICSSKIQLSNIEYHVRICQKIFILRQQISQKSKALNRFLVELKAQSQLVNGKPFKAHCDQQFKKLVNTVLCSQITRERGIRRSSLSGVKSQKSIKDKIQKNIEEYIAQNGSHKLLENILQACKQKTNLLKRIHSIQINNLDYSNERDFFIDKNTNNSSHSSLKWLEITAQKNEDEQYNQGNNSSDKPMNIKTKTTLTRKQSKCSSCEENQIPLVKNYVSLQDIFVDDQEPISISLSNFQILAFLGEGAFGKVYMVRRRQTNDIYALKIIKISEGYDQKQLETIINEHQIYKKIAGDHLVKAPFSFNEKDAHMFVLQYLPGGDLRKMLDDQVYFEEDKAKFYLAEIVLAIEHLHKYGIIHRDLKPENLVVDKNGHLKLTDFGLSQFQIKEKLAKSLKIQQEQKDIKRTRKRRAAILGHRQKLKLIGTPDYIAPQIINRTSINNFTIDWWSLGVMAYELMIGTRPFCANTIEEVIDNITEFNLEWPEIGYDEGMISPEAKDLICQLLNKDFMTRLGSEGANQLKEHPFFKGVDWVYIKSSQPPLVPKMMTFSELAEIKQDKELKEQVQTLIGSNQKSSKSNFRLDRFVRFDLLGTQTIENVEKLYYQQTDKLNKLKTIQKLQFQWRE